MERCPRNMQNTVSNLQKMKKSAMDNYVVRIYRRDTKDPRLLVGVVEEVGVEGSRAFQNLDELWTILLSGKATRGKKGEINISKGN